MDDNGHKQDPVEAGIPDLKHQEKERRQGGAAPWSVGASGGGSEFLSGSRGAFSRILGGNGSGGGIFDGLANFLASKLGMLFITAAVAGASTYSLYSIYGPAAVKPARQPVHFPKTEYSEKSTRNLPAEGPAMSSLEQLAAANRAAPDQGSAAPSAVSQNAADSSGAQPQAQPNNNYDQTAPADQSMGQRKPSLQKVAALGASGQGQGHSAAGSTASPAAPAKPSEEAYLAQARTSHGTLEGMGGGSHPTLGPARAAMGRGNLAKGSSLASMRQLGAAAGYSIGAKAAGESESKAYTAGKAFDAPIGGPTAGGLPILGAGTGSGAGPAGLTEGGPIQPTSPSSRTPQPQSTQDVTPWTSTLMMGVSMLMIASIIITIMGFLKRGDPGGVGLITGLITKMLFIMAISLAAMAMMIGMSIMSKYGQAAQGGILMTGGAIAAAAALLAWYGAEKAQGNGFLSTRWPLVMILGGIAGIGASIGALLMHGNVPMPH